MGQNPGLYYSLVQVFRAVHLELVTSLSAENFILALRRFISRRGRPSTIYSDNGKNLVGTSNELKNIDWKKLKDHVSLKKINLKLNPSSSPWLGGFWEGLIGMLKIVLRRILGKARLTYEELYAIVCDSESVIISRPLTLLIGRSGGSCCSYTSNVFTRH
ncbi:hypothetical protein AVEN_182070-1 [Araneus ventricosus]|uniref:Integrase catalytic domain-containing protein n=1 Tax=Araneus ventricosus TaxID=182803 RepID=A0A4Y2NRN0_ARAVE|nr:hypothetical protein AVEN_182070-1 [Araneus ventricosus]